jgi:hypothetical protein
MHEVSETIILSAQVAHIHNMMKTLLTQFFVSIGEPIKVIIEEDEVTCVYYDKAHLFYVGNFNKNKNL